jgi:hypothetical protein
MILDYSKFVEVRAYSQDRTLTSFHSSNDDILRSAPRNFIGSDIFTAQTIGGKLDAVHAHIRDKSVAQIQDFVDGRLSLFDAFERLLPGGAIGRERHHSKWLQSLCFVCARPTSLVHDERPRYIKVRACSECGWWESQIAESLWNDGAYNGFLLRRACLSEFAILDDAAPIDAVRRHLIQHQHDLNRLSPRKLEQLVASVFSDFLSCEAFHVGQPGDGGYDVILLLSDNPVLVQVKQHMDQKKAEPVSSIREFLGAMLLAGSKRGIFVSTANRYSSPAREAAVKANAIVQQLELVDSSRLIDVLKLTSKDAAPWRQHAIPHDLEPILDPGRGRRLTGRESRKFRRDLRLHPT